MIARNKELSGPSLPVFTKTYIIIWGISILLPLWDGTIFGNGAGGLDNRPLTTPDYLYLFPTVLATLISMYFLPDYTLPLTLVAHIIDLAIRWERMPIVWDHEQWAMQIQAAFVAHYLVPTISSGAIDHAETGFLQTARYQFALLYAAATFWKFNTSFFDPSVSCGTVLILETFSTYLPPMSPWLVQLIGEWAPHMTGLVEGAIALAIFLNLQSVTVLLGMVFHLTIFMLPVNAAGGFSMDCASRFLVFFSSQDVQNYWQRMQWKNEACVMSVVAIFLGLMRYVCTGMPPDFGFAAMGILMVFYFQILRFRQHDGTSHGEPTEHFGRVARLGMIGLTIFHGFATPILGMQHMGAPTMYSNMRYYGGSNHFLVPTSILSDDITYGGGIVQIIESNSEALNRRLAYMKSEDIFPPRSLRNIRLASNSSEFPFQFFPLCISNPHSRALLTNEYAASNPPSSTNFWPFYLPISEVKKAFQEEAYSTQFLVRMADAGTSAALQDQPPSQLIVFRGKQDCEVQVVSTGERVSCDENRAARLILNTTDVQGFLGWLSSKLLSPYPQLVGKKEVCMS